MSPFRILGLNEAATPDDVKQAWRKLASEHHPDKGGDTDSFHRMRTAYIEALARASAPFDCDACKGSGWKIQVKGWHSVRLQCSKCNGAGTVPR